MSSPSLHIKAKAAPRCIKQWSDEAGAIVDEWFPDWNPEASRRVDLLIHLSDAAYEGGRW